MQLNRWPLKRTVQLLTVLCASNLQAVSGVLGAAAFAGGSNAAGIAAALVKVSRYYHNADLCQWQPGCARLLQDHMLLLVYDGHLMLTR
jgi:hypothetical protein